MNSSESTSESKTGREDLLLPQVVYDCKGARFYNKLESWWNRPSRLQQAAEDLIYEDVRPDAGNGREEDGDIWEWLEDRARRTSILHQMLRRVARPKQDQSGSGRHTSGFANALSAKLAKEYLATLVKVMLYLSPRVEGDTTSGPDSPFKCGEEEDDVLEEILAVCARRLFESLRTAHIGGTKRDIGTGQLPGYGQLEETPGFRQAQSLTSEVESKLYALLDGFTESQLAETSDESDSDSDSYDETVKEALENLPPELKKSEIRPHSHPQPDLEGLLGIDANTDDSISTAAAILFQLISRIESDLVNGSSSTMSDGRARKACLLLDTLENLRIGLWTLYDTVVSQNTASPERGHNDNDRNGGLYCVMRLDCQESVSWTVFNACLAKTTLALAIYGHHQRTKSGNLPRRNRLRGDELGSSRFTRQSPGFDGTVAVDMVTVSDIDRTLNMTFIEKGYVELLDTAATCAESTEWTPRI